VERVGRSHALDQQHHPDRAGRLVGLPLQKAGPLLLESAVEGTGDGIRDVLPFHDDHGALPANRLDEHVAHVQAADVGVHVVAAGGPQLLRLRLVALCCTPPTPPTCDTQPLTLFSSVWSSAGRGSSLVA
jgi:hypothetical protein